MRRARIKALATVPVRRKTAQNVVTTESNSCNDDKEKDNKENNAISKEEETSATISQQDNVRDSIQNESNNQEKIIVTEPHETTSQVEETPSAQSDIVEQNHSVVVHPPEATSTIVNVLGSPTKIAQNRLCFMRPVPRLNNSGRIRRNSIQGSGASASESEDDSKRVPSNAINRTRNDSVCSIQSNKETSTNTASSNVTTKLKIGQKRRILMSESARKLAEARREFLLKHENKTPDRTKLTMYDLIYYNPSTNPMKKSRESIMNHAETDPIVHSDEMEEEKEDDPSQMPVPQVKVGPDGQLIVDEQSLVIEQSHAKKSREVLSKKAIVDDDNYGSGFYKRRPKGKEWPKWETLKFYKALNMVGTDFLLMQTLFPERSRQEIKLKYKKEEKVNRELIEKALEYHQEFSPEMEQQLADFERTIRKQFANEKEERKKNKEKKQLEKKKSYQLMQVRSIKEDITSEAGITGRPNKDAEANNNQCVVKMRKRPKSSAKRTNESINDVTNEDKRTCSTSGPESDSDTEIYKIRPTRSGRVPKVRKLQGPDVNNLHNNTTEHSDNNSEEIFENNEETIRTANTSSESVLDTEVYPDVITSAIPNISKVEPGSVVILSKESPEEPGETVLQVYMVSSNVDTLDTEVDSVRIVANTSSEGLTASTLVGSDPESTILKEEHE